MVDKVKRNQFTCLLEKNMCQGLKYLKLACELKFISPRHKISCRYFNYDIEKEWIQKKYTHIKKILVLALLFSKSLNHNFRPK